MTKATPTGFAPSYLTTPIPRDIAATTTVETMSPAQFIEYEAAIRSVDYDRLLPKEQEKWLIALRAVNKRKASELAESGPLRVTIRDGRPAGLDIPLWGWAIGAAAVMLLLGPKR